MIIRIGFVLWVVGLLSASSLAAESSPEVKRLVLAVPFELEKPYTFDWRQERPTVATGHVLVLEITPFPPKQSAEPVLYVGQQVAERINSAYPSGFAVVIVPSKLNAQGVMDDDLSEQAMWFGAAELPERIDQVKLAQAFDQAQVSGIRPFDEAEVSDALDRGGAKLMLTSKTELLQVISDLIERYSPEETGLIERLRRP